MSTRLIAVSDREEDRRLAEFLAFSNDMPLTVLSKPELVARALGESPNSLVFWDAEDADRAALLAPIFARSVHPTRVFAVTDKGLNDYPHLAAYPIFAHHLFRRYDEPAPTLYARLIDAALRGTPLGLDRYFPEGAVNRKITITRSGQKRAAVEAIENFFIKQNVNTRLSALVAQGVDELLMNAIFDAPVLPNGMPLRRGADRASDFELIEQEHAHIEVASGDEYVGLCVGDQFGSLKKKVLMSFLHKDYQDEAYVLRKGDPGAGLGLHGIIQSGLSMVFVCQPNVRTEVMIFFARGANYRDFRSGFRFLSVIAP
jgi:hypothetical protein